MKCIEYAKISNSISQQIASYLLDIITYACAVAKLGPMCNSIGIQTSGTEDIG